MPKTTFSRMVLLSAAVGLVASCAGKPSVTAKGDGELTSAIAPFTKVTLDNGLDVIVKEVRTAPIVAVYLWCNTGSINEEERVQGISHFYEHMFFKGTEKRGVGEIDRAIKSLGGYNNAFTSKEYTAYYVVLPSENFKLAADVLVDAIRHSVFPEDEIQRELGVIKEEINRKEDDPVGSLYEEMFELMFAGTPYAHSVLGTKETVSNITREDFKNYLGTYYVPNNMTAVIVGDVSAKEAIAEMKRLTSGWKPSPEVSERLVKVDIQPSAGVKGFELEKDVQMSYVMMAFRTSGYRDLNENAVLDICSSLLGEGQSSRLYRRLVEKEQLVSSVQAFIYPLKYSGLFVIFATMDPDKVRPFKAAVLEEVGRLSTEPLPESELRKVKTMLKADFQFSNETDSNIAYTLGHFNILGMLDVATEYERTIEAVTIDDVRRYARGALDTASYTIGIISPRVAQGTEAAGE